MASVMNLATGDGIDIPIADPRERLIAAATLARVPLGLPGAAPTREAVATAIVEGRHTYSYDDGGPHTLATLKPEHDPALSDDPQRSHVAASAALGRKTGGFVAAGRRQGNARKG